MLFNIVLYTVISIIVIYVGHKIFEFLKDNFTTPIVKDLIDNPKQRYKEMYSIINSETQDSDKSKEDMKNELKSFLKKNNIKENIKKERNDVNDIGYSSYNLSNNDNLQYTPL